MLLETFKFFDIWDAIESGLYYVIIGYYFLIFAYFIFMRYRTSKKLYWLYFSLLFLGLAASRVFFIIYYFYTPELKGILVPPDPRLLEIADQLMLLFRLATFSLWIGIACLMGVLGVLIFPPLTDETTRIEGDSIKIKLKNWLNNENVRLILKIVLIAIPLFIGFLVFILPDSLLMDPDIVDEYGVETSLITIFGYPAGRAVLNFILLPLFVAIIPFLFINLARRTFGVLRKSYALNAIGFFIYFIGRILQGVLDSLQYQHVRAILPPLLILLSLLIIVIANNYEQLR